MVNYQDIAERLKLLEKLSQERRNRLLEECDFTNQQIRTLMLLREAGGSMTQKLVEENISLSHATIHGIASRLEKKGMIIRKADPSDYRQVVLEITEEGLSITDRVLAANEKENNSNKLSQQEMEELARLLDKLISDSEV